VQVDVIIPVWNHLDLTQRAIASVRENTTVPYRLIVVDDGSTDGTAAWLAVQRDIVVITNETNQGFAHAVNRGLGVATASYVALLNNDVDVDKGWLATLIEGLESGPKIGAIGPLSTAKQMQWEGYHRAESGVVPIEQQGPVSLAFFCVVLRREVIDEVGLLDEGFAPAYGEDNDYAIRMKKAGWEQAICCDVLVKHAEKATTQPTGMVEAWREQARRRLREKWPGEGF